MSYRTHPVRPAPLWAGDHFTPGMFGARWPGGIDPAVRVERWSAVTPGGYSRKVSHGSGDGGGGDYGGAACCDEPDHTGEGVPGTSVGMRPSGEGGAGRVCHAQDTSTDRSLVTEDCGMDVLAVAAPTATTDGGTP